VAFSGANTQRIEASQKTEDDLSIFSIPLFSLWRSVLVGRLVEGVRQMKMTKVPSVQATAMVFKGH
jgi:hypothetical protein